MEMMDERERYENGNLSRELGAIATTEVVDDSVLQNEDVHV